MCSTDTRQVHTCIPATPCGNSNGITNPRDEVVCGSQTPTLTCGESYIAQLRSAKLVCTEDAGSDIMTACSTTQDIEAYQDAKAYIRQHGQDITARLGRISSGHRSSQSNYGRQTTPESLANWESRIQDLCKEEPVLLIEHVCFIKQQGVRYSWYFPAGDLESPIPVEECSTCVDDPKGNCCYHSQNFQCQLNRVCFFPACSNFPVSDVYWVLCRGGWK